MTFGEAEHRFYFQLKQERLRDESEMSCLLSDFLRRCYDFWLLDNLPPLM